MIGGIGSLRSIVARAASGEAHLRQAEPIDFCAWLGEGVEGGIVGMIGIGKLETDADIAIDHAGGEEESAIVDAEEGDGLIDILRSAMKQGLAIEVETMTDMDRLDHLALRNTLGNG